MLASLESIFGVHIIMFNVVSTVCADGYKVAGVLIESAPPYALIGLGVNVRQSPTVPASGPERGTTEDIS